MTSFYAYIYFDTRPGKNLQPIYVGKGKDDRYTQHLLKCLNPMLRGKLTAIKNLGLDPQIEIHPAKSEEDAFSLEMWFIYKYGRIDKKTGTLCNLTDGGDGNAGLVFTAESRAKCSASSRGRKNSEEAKTKLSAAMEKLHANPIYKEKHSASMAIARSKPEFVSKMSKSLIELHKNPEYKKKHTEAVKKAKRLKRQLAHPDWTEEDHLKHENYLRDKYERLSKNKQSINIQ